jgi:outer membrane protein assembly factor BamA
MKFVLLPLLATAAALAQSSGPAAAFDDQPQTADAAADVNVNSRYTVESISFDGPRHYRLSTAVLDEMHRLIGTKVSTEALNRLARRVRSELRAAEVTFKLARGGEPNHVKVLLEVDKRKSNFELSIPTFSYNSRQGWTGVAEASTTVGANTFTAGALSDGDTLAERFTGLKVRYDRLSLGTDRVRLGFEFDSYHEMYDRATLIALDGHQSSSLGAGAYRSRMNFEPSATFVLAKPLTLTVGLSFEQLGPQVSAAHSESANAVVNTLRYHQRWENSDATNQELDAGYNLRAATSLLASDLAYTRHLLNVRYGLRHDHQSVEVTLVAGVIYGHAPLFERFVLGNSSTLRGWNKYDLDPLGGNRVVQGSVTYGYHIMRVFYDTGSVWDQGKAPEAKQSAGVGVSSGLGIFKKGAILLAVAFPIRQGRVDPVFVAGMNF